MSETFRALVVDDDPIARKTVKFALEQEDFCCDLAVDGEDALRQLCDNTYDLVVTDLRMPNKHGYSVCTELLERRPRPVIVVHSSVDEPRLTKDLMSRGVDDIVYKPTNYAAFAAKAKGLVDHRQALATDNQPRQNEASRSQAATKREQSGREGEPASETIQSTPDGLLVPISDIENKISLVSRILPVSRTALDVFQMTRSECDATKLGATIQCDAALATEVLSIANSSFYNPSGNPLTELDRAVVRIGQQRIGELALAAASLSALTQRKLPWMDMQTVWRQSIAAGVAVEHLVAQGKHGKTADSLVLIAIMHSLGRVVLGTLYPNQYRQLVRQCTEREEALMEQERQVFPENHARIMTRLLSIWSIPDEICKPMNYILDSYASLSRLSDPTRTQVELVKLAVFVGQLATTAWHSWDLVEIPPASLLERLQIHDMNQIVEQTRDDTQAVIDFKSNASSEKKKEAPPQHASEPTGTIYYENASTLPFDFIAQFIREMDVEVASVSLEWTAPPPKILINCMGVSKNNPPPALALPSAVSVLVVTDSNDPPGFGASSGILKMPVSYGKLRSAFLDVTTEGSGSEQAASVGGYDVRV